MVKSFIFFLMIISVNFLESKETYKIVPSASLASYAPLIYKIFRDGANQHLVEGDFYLTNITRLIYYLTLMLEAKGISIEMKGFWRQQTKSDYTNHLYIYYSWENPRHDPC